jgi:hypothetical protein
MGPRRQKALVALVEQIARSAQHRPFGRVLTRPNRLFLHYKPRVIQTIHDHREPPNPLHGLLII